MREVVRQHIDVDRPRSAAWQQLADLDAWPRWASHIEGMVPTPPGELTASTQVVMHMRCGLRPKMVVTAYERPRSWVWEGRSFGVTTRFEHRLEEIGEAATRIWFLAWMSGPLAGPAGWIFARMMRRYLGRALPKLKAQIEAAG